MFDSNFLMTDEDNVQSSMNASESTVKWEDFNLEVEAGSEQIVEVRLLPSGKVNDLGKKVPYVRHLNRSKLNINGKTFIYHSPKTSLSPKTDCKVLDAFLSIREKYGVDSLEMEQFKSTFSQKATDYFYVQVLSDTLDKYKVGGIYRFAVARQQKRFWLASLIEDAQNPKNKRAKSFNPFAAKSYILSLDPTKGANGRDWSSCSFIKDAEKMGYLVSKDVVTELGQEFVSWSDTDMMELDFSAEWHLEAFNKFIVSQIETLEENGVSVAPTEEREDVIKYIDDVTSRMIDGSFFEDDTTEEVTDEDESSADEFLSETTTEDSSNVDSDDLPF